MGMKIITTYLKQLTGGRLFLYSAIFLVTFLLPIVIFSYSSNLSQIAGRLVVQHIRDFFHITSTGKLQIVSSSDQRETDVNPDDVKTVLLWTLFFGQYYDDHILRNGGPDVNLGNNKLCHFTSKRDLLNKSDALMFHGRDFSFQDLPKFRQPWQRWVFYLLESPRHSGIWDNSWEQFNKLGFNWSMTYRQTADVYAPYGVIRQQGEMLDDEAINNKIDNFTTNFWKRKRDAVWLVSNCGSDSKREIVAKVLQEHGITLDAWGGCSGRKPEAEFTKMGPAAFFSQYRFFLSFENSICDDYITEKGWGGLYYSYLAGVIPVVYGGGSYDKLFPNGSYIDAFSFKGARELARYLKTLACPSTHPTQLAPFYNWLKEVNPLYEDGYEIDAITKLFIPDYSKRIIWRNLCQRLWDEDTRTDNGKSYTTTIQDMRQRIGTCRQPNNYIKISDTIDANFVKIFKVSL